jgi:hypothetical protein
MDGVTVGGTTPEPAHFTTLNSSGATAFTTFTTNGTLTNNASGVVASVADVATGSIFISQGTTTAPAWATALPSNVTFPSPGAIGATTPSSGKFTTGVFTTSDSEQGPIISVSGTVFTIASGTGACATTSTKSTNGPIAGNFTCTGSTGASSVTLTLGATTTGYVCFARDVTTPTTVTQTGAISTTSVTFTMTSVSANDVIQFGCPISY